MFGGVSQPTTAATLPDLRRTALFTALALVGFAGNSLLCRLALAERAIDAASFTGVRLASGALVLAVLARSWRPTQGSAISAAALFAYAAPFSYAYLRLGAGMGALVLFGTVQATMIGWGLARGERPRPAVWIGLGLALAGLAGIAAPGATSPDPIGLGLMMLAGIAWGIYSLRGRKRAGSPLAITAANFLLSVPLAVALAAAAARLGALHASATGLALAGLSGAVASGLGYSLWYAALPGLTATRAAILQLLVPVLAAGGGVGLLGERVSPRLLLTGAAILGGVALAVRASARRGP
jgi:drug/metabolite transporter (DMT)-like permease